MDAQEWLDELASELSKLRTPGRYRARILGELRDHLEELSLEKGDLNMSTEALSQKNLECRVGPPTEVARMAHEQVSHRYFAARHPILTFLFLPAPVLILLWVAYAAVLIGVLSTVGGYPNSRWTESIATVVIHSLAYIPAIVLTAGLARLASRSQAGLEWWLSGSILVAIMAGMLLVDFRMPTAPGNGVFQIGFAFPPGLSQWMQIVVPLGITLCCWMLLLKKRSSQADPAPPPVSE
jgi:hypothetical protein